MLVRVSILWLLFGWAAAAFAAGPAGGHLSVRGAEILDPSGSPILLRGWNWGHWGMAKESDAADNAAQGANVVRIPLRWWGFYHDPAVDSRSDAATATAGINPQHLAMLDDTVRWASKAKLWIVLFIDSNCGQKGTQDKKQIAYCDPRGEYRDGHNFWTDPAMRTKFIAVWRFIANRYKDTPYIGMFEPLPEPRPPAGTAAQINEFYAQVGAAIREAAPGVPLLIGSTGYRAVDAAVAYNPNWKDVVYTGNLFLHRQGGVGQPNVAELRGRLQALLDLRAQRNVPIFVQQVGVRSGDDDGGQGALKAVLNHLTSNRVGFTYWEYRDRGNADAYGPYYQRGREWAVKPGVLEAITSSFKK